MTIKMKIVNVEAKRLELVCWRRQKAGNILRVVVVVAAAVAVAVASTLIFNQFAKLSCFPKDENFQFDRVYVDAQVAYCCSWRVQKKGDEYAKKWEINKQKQTSIVS